MTARVLVVDDHDVVRQRVRPVMLEPTPRLRHPAEQAVDRGRPKPAELAGQVHFTGVEIDPVTARIARLLQPSARIIAGDFTRTALP